MEKEQAEKFLKNFRQIYLWKQLKNKRWLAYFFLWDNDSGMYSGPRWALLYLDADGEPSVHWFSITDFNFKGALKSANAKVSAGISQVQRFYNHFTKLKERKASPNG